MGEGSSNKGSSNSVSEQWSSNSGRPKGVVKQGVVKTVSVNSVNEQWSSNRGRLRGVVKQWP